MIIHSLKLRNIRSYSDASIDFPSGAVLLSGDIGCGKTSILLAVEFAVFGIMKGVLSGGSLLRHGSDKGFVELSFSLGKDKVVVKRSLKRTIKGVVQDSGVLSVNGSSVEGTAQELKARILDLIGYPESLLNKSKSLIFRYTVFTPQDEMKRILYENKDDRLDILRRLFNIDKYKRVKEISLYYVRELKNRVNVLRGKLEILPDKKQELLEYGKQVDLLKEKLEDKEDDLEKLKTGFGKIMQGFERVEKELEEFNSFEKDFEVKKSELGSHTDLLDNKEQELGRVSNEMDDLLRSLAGFDVNKQEEIKERLKVKKQELRSIDDKLVEISSRRVKNDFKKKNAAEVIKKISEIDECPTCEQTVPPEHAKRVIAREQVIVKTCETNIEKLDEFEKKFFGKKRLVEEEIEKYIFGEKELEANKIKYNSLNEKKERKAGLEKDVSELKEKIEKNKILISELREKLDQQADKKKEFEEVKKELDDKRDERNELEKVVVEKKTKLATINQMIERIRQEINRMRDDEKKLARINEVKDWLQQHFINLVDVIEKNILSRIYNEFNSFFQEWFNTLLEDETISVRLDDYFSPIIEQNGYETWLENLSGGEKTSVALAYRLALNKVINDFLSTIKTRDLIILDEPTDGFSSEQLDRVREVLNQINVEQVIMVSHEAKMEGFVDSIIRIKKQGHESMVV